MGIRKHMHKYLAPGVCIQPMRDEGEGASPPKACSLHHALEPRTHHAKGRHWAGVSILSIHPMHIQSLGEETPSRP